MILSNANADNLTATRRRTAPGRQYALNVVMSTSPAIVQRAKMTQRNVVCVEAPILLIIGGAKSTISTAHTPSPATAPHPAPQRFIDPSPNVAAQLHPRPSHQGTHADVASGALFSQTPPPPPATWFRLQSNHLWKIIIETKGVCTRVSKSQRLGSELLAASSECVSTIL